MREVCVWSDGLDKMWEKFLDAELDGDLRMRDAIGKRLLQPFEEQGFEVCGVCVVWAAHGEHDHDHQQRLNAWLDKLQSSRFLDERQLLNLDGHDDADARLVPRAFYKPRNAAFGLEPDYGPNVCEWVSQLFVRLVLTRCPTGMLFAISGPGEDQIMPGKQLVLGAWLKAAMAMWAALRG